VGTAQRTVRHGLAAALVAGALVALSACGSGAGGSESDASASAPPALSGELNVYAAASLAGAFDDIAAAFVEDNPGVEVVPVYDGSSTLVTQITEGAPADVFASADEANMDRAGELAIDPVLFATNTLVVAVPAGNPGDVDSLARLAEVTTVLCAPEVPCGAASQRLLDAAGIDVTAASLEQNVTAVLTKVSTGEADAGLVYATDVLGDDAVESFVPEGADEVVNRYPLAALADARHPEAAEAFVSFVLSDSGQAILRAHGFGAP
jgi:molybdate transport system substrate-binding protein